MPLDASQEKILDNMAWHALNGPHADLADGPGDALRYPRSMAVFCATERLDDNGWGHLADMVGPGRAIVLFQPGVGPLPDGMSEIFRHQALQMVADGPLSPKPVTGPAVEVIELGADDAEDMLALTALAEPGPFFAETYRLGTYLGVREDGRLIAMAGERIRADGATEISAVSTHPDARRRGLGGLMTMAMAEVIRDRGDLAMLHVATDNAPAIPLYEQLGFRLRGKVDVVAARTAE